MTAAISEPAEPRFSDADVAHYRTHGYAIIENFLSEAELTAAREEIESYIPGWLDYAANPDGTSRPAPGGPCAFRSGARP